MNHYGTDSRPPGRAPSDEKRRYTGGRLQIKVWQATSQAEDFSLGCQEILWNDRRSADVCRR